MAALLSQHQTLWAAPGWAWPSVWLKLSYAAGDRDAHARARSFLGERKFSRNFLWCQLRKTDATMPLSLEELQDIQAEAMADDIEIDFAKMSLWTKEQATTFFETGDEPPPPYSPDPYMMKKLDSAELSHLKEIIGQEKHGKHGTVAGLVDLIRTDRSKFLPTLKDMGIAKLPDRQALRDLIMRSPTRPRGRKMTCASSTRTSSPSSRGLSCSPRRASPRAR